MGNIIEVSNLHKSYGDVRAVQGLDFYVEQGSVFAFLGPNGAGKSTTIDVLCTFLQPDSGKVVVDGNVLGENDNAIRSSIGVVFQRGMLDDLLTVRENLRLRGGFYGLKGKELDRGIEFAAQTMGIADILKRPYGKLSGGQRRRCDIARALLHTPNILFLDEPTTGLDPQTRNAVWETVVSLKQNAGMTVFLTTHYMEEAAGADYVTVIDGGRISAKGTPAQLKERYTSDRLKLVCKDVARVTEVLTGMNLAFAVDANRVTVSVPSTLSALPVLGQVEGDILGFEVTTGTMDDAFLAITGKEIRP